MKANDESQRNECDDGDKTKARFSKKHGKNKLKVGESASRWITNWTAIWDGSFTKYVRKKAASQAFKANLNPVSSR